MIIHSFLTNEIKYKLVGEKNKINLPVVDFELIREKIGSRIADGYYGKIYEVKDSHPPRVFKIISLDDFENGNEIQISKIAGELGVAPIFHQAFVVKEGAEKVFIEMEHAGKSFAELIAELPEEKILSEEEQAILDIQREIEREFGGFCLVSEDETQQKLDQVIDTLYEKKENFYLDLFSKIKTLAENCIAFHDTHDGNIMYNEKGLQLIDFDSSEIKPSISKAVEALFYSEFKYNKNLFNKFRELDNLSDSSKELIDWYRTQIGDPKIKKIAFSN